MLIAGALLNVRVICALSAAPGAGEVSVIWLRTCALLQGEAASAFCSAVGNADTRAVAVGCTESGIAVAVFWAVTVAVFCADCAVDLGCVLGSAKGPI